MFFFRILFDPSIWMMPELQENDDNKERELQNEQLSAIDMNQCSFLFSTYFVFIWNKQLGK